jgi:hypothetical protein
MHGAEETEGTLARRGLAAVGHSCIVPYGARSPERSGGTRPHPPLAVPTRAERFSPVADAEKTEYHPAERIPI